MMWIARGLAFKLSSGQSINQCRTPSVGSVEKRPTSGDTQHCGSGCGSLRGGVRFVEQDCPWPLYPRRRQQRASGSSRRLPNSETLLSCTRRLLRSRGLVSRPCLATSGRRPEVRTGIRTLRNHGSCRRRDESWRRPGRVGGTLLGALMISVVQVGMDLIHVDRFSQMIVLGAILLTAVLIDRRK